jgi:hypothetical protein
MRDGMKWTNRVLVPELKLVTCTVTSKYKLLLLPSGESSYILHSEKCQRFLLRKTANGILAYNRRASFMFRKQGDCYRITGSSSHCRLGDSTIRRIKYTGSKTHIQLDFAWGWDRKMPHKILFLDATAAQWRWYHIASANEWLIY